ncbi:MAG: hypothetical protein JO219_02050 [Candidatus Eremiobacteraeota bacterium]|nr:hypothetical protein [Candidatus Eremiobacteraeota bacterium]MBV8365897.1 hypothetical protein [Candidatus Eremiobacteraeota bacterium]
MRLLSKLLVFTVAFGVLCAAAATAASTNITVHIHNSNVAGLACPFAENFTGTIHGPANTPITYRWERSNGYLATHSTTIPAGGSKQVSDVWTTSKSGAYWARLHVLTPQSAVSDKGTFQVHCPGGM